MSRYTLNTSLAPYTLGTLKTQHVMQVLYPSTVKAENIR